MALDGRESIVAHDDVIVHKYMGKIIVKFVSDAHQRYENGNPVMGHQQCGRMITVEANTDGCSGYKLVNGDGFIVKIHNLDVDKPNMSPKPMRVVSSSNEKVELKGYPVQAMTPFGWNDFDLSDYGLTLIMSGDVVKQCTLHMFDRNVDIEYYIESGDFPRIDLNEFVRSNSIKEKTDVEKYAMQSMQLLKSGNESEAYSSCVNCYAAFKYSPEVLRNVRDYENVGMSLLTLLTFDTIDDIDVQQRIASVSYLFLSKGLQDNPENINMYRCRFLLLHMYHEPFQYTVMSALNLNSGFDFFGGMSSFTARDAMHAMKFADLQDCPMLSRIDSTFVKAEQDLRQKISSGFFGNNESNDSFAERGRKNHAKLLQYLENMVLENADIDF